MIWQAKSGIQGCRVSSPRQRKEEKHDERRAERGEKKAAGSDAAAGKIFLEERLPRRVGRVGDDGQAAAADRAGDDRGLERVRKIRHERGEILMSSG